MTAGFFALTDQERAHWLKVFILMFRRKAFLPTPSDDRTFHQRAIEEGHFYEERVAENLSNLVFVTVFPELARAIAQAAPDAPLHEVRETTGGEGQLVSSRQGATSRGDIR